MAWGSISIAGIIINYTGDLEALREPYPRLLRFAQYLQSIVGSDGLLPVENMGIPSVWIDHIAYQQQRHKQCAFNLYAAAAMEHALAPHLPRLWRCQPGRRPSSSSAATAARRRSAGSGARSGNFSSTTCRGWPKRSTRALCDRSLATAILFDQCPGRQTAAALRLLAECPPEMGFSYPATPAGGCGRWPRAAAPTSSSADLRQRWATMASVKQNNTLQEDWNAQPDSGQQWSHCAVVPLYIAIQGLAGIRPLSPGFRRAEVQPQLANLHAIALTVHTVRGPFQFTAQGAPAVAS